MMTDRIIPALIVIGAVAAWIPSTRQDPTRAPMGGGDVPMPSASLLGDCLTQAQTADMQALVKTSDVAFICGMIPHHQAAIDLAQVMLKSGEDPDARAFAEQVIRDRGREIAEMKDWLTKHAEREGRR
jgi:uncharacterized protein (DUF305 family)